MREIDRLCRLAENRSPIANGELIQFSVSVIAVVTNVRTQASIAVATNVRTQVGASANKGLKPLVLR